MSSTPDDTRGWAVLRPRPSHGSHPGEVRPHSVGARPGGRSGEDLVLVALVILAAALRFATLSTQSLWSDEGFTAQIATHSLGAAASQIPHTESTPPLYYACVWVWAHVFGSSAFALRSLSAVFGTLTVAGVHWAGRGRLSARVALAAGLLTAVSPIMVWYSQEARAYALLVLLCVLALGCFVRALEEDRRAWLIGWALCSAAALATHYFAVFPLVAEATWLLARLRPRRRELAVVLVIPAAVGAALLPLLLYQSAHVPRPWTSALTVRDQLEATAQSFLVGISWTPIIHRAAVAALAILTGAALLALARGGDRAERDAGRELALLALVILGIPVLVSLGGTNYLAPRNVLYVWPLLALLVAAGACRRTAGRLSLAALLTGAAVSLAVVIAGALTPALQRQDWRDLLAPLRAGTVPRAVVALDGFDDGPVLRYYVPGLRIPGRPLPVREVDVVTKAALAAQAGRLVPLAGLNPAGVVVRGQLALSRFVSVRAVTMPPAPPPGSGEAYFVRR